ncbi:MAG TPA: radical SAM family heme chaperone HemW [Syntrophales bacterium]|nr:radical SAM family heme chaperone HemW [Syntrophales bacterium]
MPAGLYIHVPFCKSKCPYCHFYSTTETGCAARFIDALDREMRGYRHRFAAFDTIYIGGGTPSLLTIADLDRILAAVHRHFTIAGDAETTVEVNPADANGAWFSDLHGLGVNRIHLGGQSFSAPALQFLGRRHTPQDIYEAATLIRGAGFDNFGIDLIWGLPGQNLADWRRDLTAALYLEPAHLSVYQLSAEPGTPLRRRLRCGEFSLPGEEPSLEFFLATDDLLGRASFLHYEVSNYARRPEFSSRHNGKYWRHVPYLGLGPSAHSFQDGRRWWNHRNLNEYLASLADGRLPVAGSETLGPNELRLETLFLGLRTADGIDLSSFRRRFGEELRETRKEILAALISEALLIIAEDCLKPTARGMATADRLSIQL